MNEVELIKYNQECLCCKRFFYNSGDCKGRANIKINCLAFDEIKTYISITKYK